MWAIAKKPSESLKVWQAETVFPRFAHRSSMNPGSSAPPTPMDSLQYVPILPCMSNITPKKM